MTDLVQRSNPSPTPSKELVPLRRTILPRAITERLPAIPLPDLGDRLPDRLREWFAPPRPESLFALGEERTIPPIRKHWIVPIRDTFAIKRAGIMPAIFATLLVLGWTMPGVWWILMCKFIVAMGHLLYMLYAIASWRFDVVVVTDRQLLRMHGVFIRAANGIELDRIKERDITQTIPGRILGYGTVLITASDNSQGRLGELDFIPSPARLYRATL